MRRAIAASKQQRAREDSDRLHALVRDVYNAARNASNAGSDLARLDRYLVACAAACSRARARVWLARPDSYKAVV
jgi:hypothetical protein